MLLGNMFEPLGAIKANGRDKRGSTSRPSIFVVTVLTPATTETEDSPTVSSCPTIYIATRVPGNAHVVDDIEGYGFAAVLIVASFSCGKTDD